MSLILAAVRVESERLFNCVRAALVERVAGFSDRERGDYLSADDMVADIEDDVVDAEVHCEGCQCPVICGCGREMYSEREHPGSHLLWFHTEDDTPISVDCAHYARYASKAHPDADPRTVIAGERDWSAMGSPRVAANVAAATEMFPQHTKTSVPASAESPAGSVPPADPAGQPDPDLCGEPLRDCTVHDCDGCMCPSGNPPCSHCVHHGCNQSADHDGPCVFADTDDLNGDPEVELALARCEIEAWKRRIQFARMAFIQATGYPLILPN